MPYAYDDSNIFARILRGEIPNNTVAETEHTLAFRDIRPLAPSHVLVIPKGKYVTLDDFAPEFVPHRLVYRGHLLNPLLSSLKQQRG